MCVGWGGTVGIAICSYHVHTLFTPLPSGRIDTPDRDLQFEQRRYRRNGGWVDAGCMIDLAP